MNVGDLRSIRIVTTGRPRDDRGMRYHELTGPLAVAHRGGAGLAPENTMEAFRRSYAIGIRYLETDVRVTADDQLVAFHDATLGRMTPDRGRVRMRTLAELRRMPVLGGGYVLPLADLLRSFPCAFFTLDVKVAEVEAPLARLLEQTGSTGRVCVTAARARWLRALREQTATDLTTALSWHAIARLMGTARALRTDPGCRYAHIPLRLGPVAVFDVDVLSRAHDLGLKVIVWTVNKTETMHRLLDCGVDGIITDRPDLLRETLIARGQWTTPEGYETSPTSSTNDPTGAPS